MGIKEGEMKRNGSKVKSYESKINLLTRNVANNLLTVLKKYKSIKIESLIGSIGADF